MQWSVGQLVTSKQGRDCGRRYVIIHTEAKCCYVADGRKFTAASPKKKKYKHLQGTLNRSPEIAAAVAAAKLPRDEELRQFLNNHWPEDGIKEE